jgi:uncharacterized protein YcgI (DUF1989 family)
MTVTTATVRAGTGQAFPLAAGERIRIVNTHGSQVVDTWALCPPDGAERLSMEHTRTSLSRLVPRVGDPLHSNLRRPLLWLAEDTAGGVHDTVIAACDAERYRQLGWDGPHANCCENFRTALGEIGIEHDPVPSPLNLFMNIPWSADGTLEFRPSPAAPGQYVTLLAERDVVVVLSACPMDITPINGEGRTPSDVDVLVLGRP